MSSKDAKKKPLPPIPHNPNPVLREYFANTTEIRAILRKEYNSSEAKERRAEKKAKDDSKSVELSKDAVANVAELSKFLGPKKQSKSTLWDRGFSVEALLAITEEVEKIEKDDAKWSECPGDKLKELILQPETQGDEQTYFEHIERVFAKAEDDEKDDEEREKIAKLRDETIGPVNIFVSHAWRYRFGDVVRAIKQWQEDWEKEEKYKPHQPFRYFLDYVAVNQHNPMPDLANLEKVIKNSKILLAMISPYDDPTTLTRSWCTLEMAFANSHHTQVHITFLPGQVEKFKKQFRDRNTWNIIRRKFEDVDVRKATAYMPKDREQIEAKIAMMGGHDEINKMVKREIKKGLISIAKDFAKEETKLLKEYKGQGPADLIKTNEIRYEILKNVATFLRQEGELEKSLEFLRASELAVIALSEALAQVDDDKKESDEVKQDHQEACEEKRYRTKNSIGNTLRDLGQRGNCPASYKKALTMYQEAFDWRKANLGVENIDTIQSQLNLARCLVDLGEYEKAHEMLIANAQGWKNYIEKMSEDKKALKKCIYKEFWAYGDLADCYSRYAREHKVMLDINISALFKYAVDNLIKKSKGGVKNFWVNHYRVLWADHLFANSKNVVFHHAREQLLKAAEEKVFCAFSFLSENGNKGPDAAAAWKLLKKIRKAMNSDDAKEEEQQYSEIQEKLFKREWKQAKGVQPPMKNKLRIMHWNVLADKLAYGDLKKDDFGSLPAHIHWENSFDDAIRHKKKMARCHYYIMGGLVGKRLNERDLSDELEDIQKYKAALPKIRPGRRSKIEAEILMHNPDVLVMAELDKRFDIGMQLDIHRNYESVWKKKKKDFYEDGSGVFFNTNRLKKVKELHEFIKDPKTGKDSDQVIVAVELARADDNLQDDFESFVVAGVHLKSTKEQAGEKLRLKQAQYVMKRLRDTWPDKEIILTADLNAEAGGNESGCLNYKPECHPWLLKEQGLRSVYPTVTGAEPKFTSWKKRVPQEKHKKPEEFKYAIDFIFVTKEIEPLAVLEMPSEDQFDGILKTLLPSEQCGSDHLSLVCDVKLQSGCTKNTGRCGRLHSDPLVLTKKDVDQMLHPSEMSGEKLLASASKTRPGKSPTGSGKRRASSVSPPFSMEPLRGASIKEFAGWAPDESIGTDKGCFGSAFFSCSPSRRS